MSNKYKRYRKDFEFSYSLGVFPTLELLKLCPEQVECVLISSDSHENEGVAKIIERCENLSLPVKKEDRIIGSLSPREDCYAIGVFRKRDSILNNNAHHLVLVNPGDMGNLGAVLRSMAGFNITNLALIRPAVDIWNPHVVRASMGSVFHVNYQYFDQFEDYCNTFDRPFFAFSTSARKELRHLDIKQPSSLVFGNEGAGLPTAVLNRGTTVRIVHQAEIDSLNLAVSVGIVLYEISRKENQ